MSVGAGSLGEAAAPTASPLQAARDAVARIRWQAEQAAAHLPGDPLAALAALKNVEAVVNQARKALYVGIRGDAPQGARMVLLHGRTKQSAETREQA